MIGAKKKQSSAIPEELDGEKIEKQIRKDASALGFPVGMADMIARQAAEAVMDWAKKRSAVTPSDIDRRIAVEVKKYNRDLAYVYENRGKII